MDVRQGRRRVDLRCRRGDSDKELVIVGSKTLDKGALRRLLGRASGVCDIAGYEGLGNELEVKGAEICELFDAIERERDDLREEFACPDCAIVTERPPNFHCTWCDGRGTLRLADLIRDQHALEDTISRLEKENEELHEQVSDNEKLYAQADAAMFGWRKEAERLEAALTVAQERIQSEQQYAIKCAVKLSDAPPIVGPGLYEGISSLVDRITALRTELESVKREILSASPKLDEARLCDCPTFDCPGFSKISCRGVMEPGIVCRKDYAPEPEIEPAHLEHGAWVEAKHTCAWCGQRMLVRLSDRKQRCPNDCASGLGACPEHLLPDEKKP